MKQKEFFRKTGLAILIIVFTLTWAQTSTRAEGKINAVGFFSREVMAPFQEAVTSIRQLFTHISSYPELLAENSALKKRVQELVLINSMLEEYRLENERLARLLVFKSTVAREYELLPAAVIGRSPSRWYQTLTINCGKEEGVRPNLAVITPEGLVGRISLVTAHTAEVLLITDKESAVGALTQNTRIPGIIEGGEEGNFLALTYLPLGIPVPLQETVVTSGLGGIFPKGLKIGQIVQIAPEPAGLMQEAKVAPFVDFNRLEEVLVILEEKGRE